MDDDTLLSTFYYLSANDIIKISSVCKQFNFVTNDKLSGFINLSIFCNLKVTKYF